MRDHFEIINLLYLNESTKFTAFKGSMSSWFLVKKLNLFSHHATEFQPNNDPVLLFNLRLYLGVASVFFPLLQGPLTQRWIWIELCEYFQVLAEGLALLRHSLEAFEPFSPLNKNLNNFIHVLAITFKRSDFS